MVENRVTAEAGIDLLLAAGMKVHVSSSSGLDLAIRQGAPRPFQLKVRQKPPTPSEINRDLELTRRADYADTGLLYVVPRLTSTLRMATTTNQSLAVAALRDQTVLIGNREFQPASRMQQPALMHGPVRRLPWGRHALVRALLRTSEPRSQTTLAQEAGITQAAVSQGLNALQGHVARRGRGWVATNPDSLFEQFLTTYPGPRGITTHWYGLDPVAKQAQQTLQAGADANALLSGDSAADLISPWRLPARAVVYAQAGLNLQRLGFAESTSERATLEYTLPADHTLWATAAAWAGRVPLHTADPLITAWDVRRIGGPDASEAVGKLRHGVLSSWSKAVE